MMELTKEEWKEITTSEEVVELIKQRDKIEEKVSLIDKMALINYELKRLEQ